MTQSFTFQINASDATVGLPKDRDYLIQRWFWYSLDGRINAHGGSLFDPDNPYPNNLTTIGSRYLDYVPIIPLYDNLFTTNVRAKTIYYRGSGFPADEQVTVIIANSGNRTFGTITKIYLWEGNPQVDGKLIGSIDIPHPLPGCGATETLLFTWSGAMPYHPHALYVGIGPLVDGNLTRFDVVTGPPQIFFPLVYGDAGGVP
jgi:hypothetical protein